MMDKYGVKLEDGNRLSVFADRKNQTENLICFFNGDTPVLFIKTDIVNQVEKLREITNPSKEME